MTNCCVADGNATQSIILSEKGHPTKVEKVCFIESPYTQDGWYRMPPPDEVRRANEDTTGWTRDRPPLVLFPSAKVIVKYGTAITISEALCMQFMKQHFGGRVPVPEIIGWCQDGDDTFIYMELLEGDTLEERWEGLSGVEKTSICAQIKQIITCVRSIERPSDETFVGDIRGGSLSDVFFEACHFNSAGPWPNMAAFGDWLSRRYGHEDHGPLDRTDPINQDVAGFWKDQPIVFTHSDIHRRNILISKMLEGSPPKVVGLIDWHQSGWLPRDWEVFKARYTRALSDEWRTKYLPMLLDDPDEEFDLALEYVSMFYGG